MTELVQPQHTNYHGTIFGGVVMSWIDTAGAIAAQRHSELTCVTASIDELHFLWPIFKGDIVSIQARVTCVHRTSCEVEVIVSSESPFRKEKKRTTADAFLTFVAIGANGHPTEMPQLLVESDEEKQLQDDGKLRKAQRQKFRQELLQRKSIKKGS